MPAVPTDLPNVGRKTRATKEDARRALHMVAAVFGVELARWVERVWRKETGHFKHGFRETCGAGMHPWAKTYPWGWRQLRGLWDRKPGYRPIGYLVLVEGGTKRPRPYLVFPHAEAFAMSLAWLIWIRSKEYKSIRWAVGSWYSREAELALQYARDAERIGTPYVDEIEGLREVVGREG